MPSWFVPVAIIYLMVGFCFIYCQRLFLSGGPLKTRYPRTEFLLLTWAGSRLAYRMASVFITFVWPVYVLVALALAMSWLAVRSFLIVFGTKEWEDYRRPPAESVAETPRFEHRMAVERLDKRSEPRKMLDALRRKQRQ